MTASLPEKGWSGLENFRRVRLRATLSTQTRRRAILDKVRVAVRRAKEKVKVKVREMGEGSEISLASPLAQTHRQVSVTCMFDTDNAPTMTVHTLTYPKTKSSVHLGKAAPISGMRPAGATMRTRIHADVAREKERGEKERGLTVPRREERTRMLNPHPQNLNFNK